MKHEHKFKDSVTFYFPFTAMLDHPSLLKLAEYVAKKAGRRLANRPERYHRVNAEPVRDIKLQADVETEALIRRHLSEASLPILGEEYGGDTSLIENDNLFWVVDPLDGTYNYLRNIPLNCVSIGLFSGLTPVLGVIYDFNLDELFSAIVDETGLLINGRLCEPQWETRQERAILTTGAPSAADLSRMGSQSFLQQMTSFCKVRMIGSAALALAYVAAGRCDVYHERRIYLWDVAAGMALVKAAGGICQLIERENDPIAYTLWAGSDSALWDEFK